MGGDDNSVQTSMTTMAREYMSDSFVTDSGSIIPMDSSSGAIHLTASCPPLGPALFEVEADAWGDSIWAVTGASPKSHRTALLLSSMRMLDCASSMRDVTKRVKFTYSFEAPVYHMPRMKVVQAAGNIYEL